MDVSNKSDSAGGTVSLVEWGRFDADKAHLSQIDEHQSECDSACKIDSCLRFFHPEEGGGGREKEEEEDMEEVEK